MTTSHSLTVDYDRSLAEMVEAGAYDGVNAYATEELFPIRGRGRVAADVALVCLGRTASTEELLRELAGRGLRPGRIEELLGLGAAEPDLQRSFPIVALGAVAHYPHDYRRIPFLWGTSRVRRLDLRWDEHSWGENIRFLAVPE